jgi:hypothetical protein
LPAVSTQVSAAAFWDSSSRIGISCVFYVFYSDICRIRHPIWLHLWCKLPKTIADCRRTGEPALESFVTGLRADQDAVTAGLTLPWSSGSVDGHVTLKMIKRQMYGRATFPLLRKRVILHSG